MRLIECRSCRSPYCDGCNIYILATRLRQGKLNCLMDEHHTIIIDPEELRPKGRWLGKPIAGYSTVKCSNCRSMFESNQGKWHYCPNCGAKMEAEK